RRVLLEPALDRGERVHHGRVVAAAELGADPGERHDGVLAAEVHGELARHGEARRAPRARELVAAQAVVLAHLADDALGARPAASTIWRALSWSALKVWANSSCERRFSARNWMSSTISVWMPRNFRRKRSMRRASRAAIISFTKFSAVRHTTVPSGRAWARAVATAESRWVLPSPQPPQRKSGLKRAPGCATTARAAP